MSDPEQIAEARRVAADPAAHLDDRARMRRAFLLLKAQRGQPVTGEQLLRIAVPHYLIRPAPGTPRTAAEIQQETIPKIHHQMRRRGFTPGGGDAA